MILAALALAAALSAEIYARPQTVATLPDGRRMNYLCTGPVSAGPTVLLEAGWSNSNLAWREVQPLVARKARVCSYDRAGLGFSDPAPGPRDTAHIVADLEALLKAAGLKPPYIVVGYSMGGLSMRLFADRNPGSVVGMVLVEPSSEHQNDRFLQAMPHLAMARRPILPSEGCVGVDCPPPGPPLPASVKVALAEVAARPTFQSTILAELVGMNGAGSGQVAASKRSYGSMPVIILTGADNLGDPSFKPEDVAAFRRIWNTMHQEIADLSLRGEHRSVPGATHLIVFERPDQVSQAITEVSAQSQP